MARNIIIVGAGTAGTTAAIYARRKDRAAQITLLTNESYPEYSRCGLPYVVSKHVPELKALIANTPEFYREVNKLDLKLQTSVSSIRPQDKVVEAVDKSKGATTKMSYDSLILATGAIPVVPAITGIQKKGVFVVRTMNDIRNLETHLLRVTSKRIVIVGGGLIGFEMADALNMRGHEVVIVELLETILSNMLDPDMADIVKERAENAGVRVMLGTPVSAIEGDGSVSGVKVGSEHISAETVIVAARVKPTIQLAENSGLRIGETGGIWTDDYMRTSDPSVYAAGDCAEVRDAVSGGRILIQLATTAARQAAVAGTNAAGGDEKYPGTTGVATTKLFGLEIASAGLTMKTTERLSKKTISARVTGSTRLPYYPGGTPLTVKLLAGEEDSRLLGAQIIGNQCEAALRGDFLSLAMHQGLSVHYIAQIETCYAPPVAPFWSPITLAAQAVERKIQAKRISEKA